MGDRAQVAIHDRTIKINDFEEQIHVYLYTHWQGSDLLAMIKRALDRGRDRWTDGEYLARIIFSEMTSEQEKSTTGFGISTSSHGDIFRPIPVLWPELQTVTWEYPNGIKERLPEMSFEQFVTHKF